MQGLLGGEIDLLCPQPPIVLPLARDGKIRAYAVTAKKRMAIAPEIPNRREAGEPDLMSPSGTGSWAPKGTPKPIVASLNAAIVDALADPAVMNSLGDAGQDIPPRDEQTPEAFGAFQKAEVEKCGPSSKRRILKQSSLAKTPAKEYRPSAPHCRFVALRAASAPLGS
jgi:tripartite-type tricarboxylate transporter receptor subunit TctC